MKSHRNIMYSFGIHLNLGPLFCRVAKIAGQQHLHFLTGFHSGFIVRPFCSLPVFMPVFMQWFLMMFRWEISCLFPWLLKHYFIVHWPAFLMPFCTFSSLLWFDSGLNSYPFWMQYMCTGNSSTYQYTTLSVCFHTFLHHYATYLLLSTIATVLF